MRQTETGDGQDPEFDFSLFFVYETRYIDKLAKKDLEIALYNKKKFSSDKCFGTVSVDLLTVASGPVKHSLPLSEVGAPVLPRVSVPLCGVVWCGMM